MAAVPKSAYVKEINKYRAQGLGDQQIMISLLKREDMMGKNLQTMLERAQQSGSQAPLEDIGGLLGLSPKRAAGSRSVGKVNKKPTFKDGLVSSAMSAGMALVDKAGGIVQANKRFADGVNSAINKVAGTRLDTKASERYRKDVKKANEATEGARTIAGRKGADLIRLGTGVAAELPFYIAGSGTTAATRMGQQALIGSGIGAAGYAESDKERLKNTAGSAIGAGLGQGAGEVIVRGVAKVAPKIINAKRGVLKDGAKEVDGIGKKHGVRTSVGDIGRGPIVKKTETIMEQVPVVGTSGFRKAQHDEAKGAALKVTEKLKDAMSEAEFKALPSLKAAADAGDRNAARVLDVVENSGDDAGRVLQAGAEMRAWRESKVANKMYDNVQELVAKLPDSKVNPDSTTDLLSKKLSEETASLAPDEALVRDLTAIQERLSDPNIAKNFNNMRLLRSQLGDMAEKYMKGSTPNRSAAKFFGDLRTAAENDIGKFVARTGSDEIRRSYQRADSFYKGMMRRKDAALTKAMKSNKPDEIIGSFIKSGKADRADNFYRALDPKAQSALRYQMADTALGKATNDSTGHFSPATFALEFERMSAPYEQVFKGADKAEMSGFVKLMRHVERAGRYMEDPPTGNRVIGAAMGTGTVLNPALAVKVGTTSAIAKFLFTTPTGKKLLLAANKLSHDEAEQLKRILELAAKLAAELGSEVGEEVVSEDSY